MSKPKSRASVSEWDATGRHLRTLDPDRYEKVLDIAQRMVMAYLDPMGAAPPLESPPASRSEQRAQKRRAAFKVIDGGTSRSRPRPVRSGGAA